MDKSSQPPGGAKSEVVLCDDSTLRKDIGLVSRAVREKWPIKAKRRRQLVERLLDITEKTEVSVITKAGDIESVDGPADVNAIAAARVLVAMTGQNQAAAKPAQPPANVMVQVNVNAGRTLASKVIERVRTERISGGDSGE